MLKATTELLGPDHFRVLCAWCTTELRAARIVRAHQPPPESHGICVACAVKMGMPADYFERKNVA